MSGKKSRKGIFIKTCTCLYDEKTKARLDRENEETWKGFVALEKYKRRLKEEALKLQVEDKDEKKIEEEEKEEYELTKWTKLKIFQQKREYEMWKEYWNKYKVIKFCTAVIRLKISLLKEQWHRSCHFKERKQNGQKIRSDDILRIRWEYNIPESFPSDSKIFDKILKSKKEKKKQEKLRKERKMEIIAKIFREMRDDIFPRRPKYICSRRYKVKEITSVEKTSFEEIRSEEFAIVEKDENMPMMEEQVGEASERENKIEEEWLEEDEKDDEAKVKGDEIILKKIVLKKSVKTSKEQVFPIDTCFYATPSVVIFEDFEVNENYSRKVTITNKTSKWAYIRFHKVYTKIWEPGVVEIEIMDAARVKPGLHVAVNVKFSPIYEEEVTAEIAFLTLSPDYDQNFHEFRVHVHCTPQIAMPILDPDELRFPSAPIWKYDDPKLSERILTIYNNGKKSFSIVIEERKKRDHCFLWRFEQDVVLSEESSMMCISNKEGNNNENILENEKCRKLYQIEILPKFKCNFIITFRPKYIGVHHEVLEINFLSGNRILGKKSIPMWAEVLGYQIRLDPLCIDLGIVMIDSDVSQQTFNIYNIGHTMVELLIKTPKNLRNHVSVHPKSTTVDAKSRCKINVRLIPESNILTSSKRFYNPVSNILEFPIKVQILSQDSQERPPPLIMKTIASLTPCNGLILEPASIDLGFVHTHESVYAELTLTNESLLIQEYAFIDLPLSADIQPNNYGFILPGETIKLHLIYSPCPTDIPGNKIGANGLTGQRRFLVEVFTLAELAGKKKQAMLSQLKDRMNKQMAIFEYRGIPPPFHINLTKSKIVRQLIDRDNNNKLKDDSDPNEENDKHPCEEEEKKRLLDDTVEMYDLIDERKQKNLIEVYVYIIDTFCELSEQIIQFPATPCGSYSMVSVHLRGFNLASYPYCTCGIIKEQRKKFTGWYEFTSSSNKMDIIPQSGVLQNDEIININFIFQPKLPKKMIFEEGLRLKMNMDEVHENQEVKSEKEEKVKKAKKEKKKIEETEVDMLAGEISLLETFEPCVSTIFVTCTINIETKIGARHDERLFAKLICPIIKPDIVILNGDRVIEFEPTAIGMSSKKFLFVKNISTRSVKIEVSVLNPFGPFFVPPGRTIETGSILKLPVTYQPSEDYKSQEYFEIFSSKTKTKWSIKLIGRGVVPSYILKPQFRVARFEVISDKPVELKMSIQNTGSCTLVFQLFFIDVLEGEIPQNLENSNFSRKQTKKKKNKEEKHNEKNEKSIGKGSKKMEGREDFGDKLSPNEYTAIYGGNLKRSEDQTRFSFFNLDENRQLLVPERKKVEFGVHFQIDLKKTKVKKEEKSNYCHVALIKLTLGSATLQDFIMICSIN